MRKSKKGMLAGLCVLLVAVNAAIAIWLVATIVQDTSAVLQPEPQALPLPADMTGPQYTQTLGDAHRMVTLYSEPQVHNGQIGIMLSNAEENQYAVRMDLIRLDNQQLIARTDLVDPGWRVEDIPLMETLASGRYFCLAKLSFYVPDGTAVLGETARQVLLTID